MVIDVPADLCPVIAGKIVTTAPTISELHALLGPPSRIAEPAVKAPVGHRNNCWHVYDSAGIFFYEHHYTRRISGCGIVYQPDDALARNAPRQSFSGSLRLGACDVLPQTSLADLLRGCGIAFKRTLIGFRASRDDFSVILSCNGVKLPSGRRSKTLRLVSVELSWPHDPWGTPAC